MSVTARVTNPTHFRFWILDCRLPERESTTGIRNIWFIGLSSLIENRKPRMLSNYLVGSRQHIRRNPNDFGFAIFDFGLFGHRITRSALAKTLGGMVNPICLAVFRLITSSNFVGCSTGRSAGLAPLRILSTYHATRR